MRAAIICFKTSTEVKHIGRSQQMALIQPKQEGGMQKENNPLSRIMTRIWTLGHQMPFTNRCSLLCLRAEYHLACSQGIQLKLTIKSQLPGWVWQRSGLSYCPSMPTSHIKALLQVPATLLWIQLPANVSGKAKMIQVAESPPPTWGDLDGVPSSRPWPYPALAIVVISGMNQKIKDRSLPFVFLSNK